MLGRIWFAGLRYAHADAAGHAGTAGVPYGHTTAALTLQQVDAPFAFSALPNTAQEIEATQHITELPATGRTSVMVLGAMRGVGGIDSLTDVEGLTMFLARKTTV